MKKLSMLILALAMWSQPAAAQSDAADRFQLADVFQLELAADPQISPDGSKIVYVRSFMDIMTDRRRSNLWIIDYDGTDHRPLTTGNANYSSPRWSPDGSRLLYVSSADGSSQIYVRFIDDGQTAKLTNLQMSPSSITWSPDGKWIALEMMVPQPAKPMVQLPPKPPGAEWAKPAKFIDRAATHICLSCRPKAAHQDKSSVATTTTVVRSIGHPTGARSSSRRT